MNIILPLKGKLSSLSLFLDNLVKKILPIDENISLTIVHFNDGNADKVQSLLKQKLSTVPKFEWKFIPTNETVFSRGKGLSLGVKYGVKAPSDLVFGCDVDVLFLPEFLSRCRSNTIFEHQVCTFYLLILTINLIEKFYLKPDFVLKESVRSLN